MIGIGRTRTLTGDSENGVHIVVTHVSSLCCYVLWIQSAWESLLAHYCWHWRHRE